MNLQHTVKTGISLVTEVELLTYTYTGIGVLQVIARATIGDNSAPIVGNGLYSLRFYVNNTLITPVSDDNVPNGVTKTMIVSRPVPIIIGDIVSIRVVGLGGDTSVNTVADLYDATSLTVADVQGAGTTIVDHNYGGINALSYQTSVGAGIGGATITVYLKSNYDAGLRSADYVLGRTRTNGDGTWARSIALNSGTYTLIYLLQGSYGPDRKDLVIP